MPAGKKLISFATIIKTVYNPNPEQSMKISIRTAMALKTKALAGGLSLLFLLGGCHKKVNYFNGEIITVKDIPVSDTLTGERLLLDSINTGMLSLCDTTLFFMGHRTPDYHYYCFNTDGRFIAGYFQKGRGADEYFSITPIIQKYKENGEWKALFTAINEEKAGIFNITKSLQQRKTVCDTIFDFRWRDKSSRSFMSVFIYDENNILAYKQAERRENTKTDVDPMPQWLLIDRRTGKINKTYDLYSVPKDLPAQQASDNRFFSSLNLLNNDRTRMVMTMPLVPQLNILDLETGILKGYRIENQPTLENLAEQSNDLRQYYGCPEIDDRFIYVLYLDRNFMKREENKGCTLYVFDWEGQLVYKLYIPEGIDQIQVDAKNRLLYGVNLQMEEVYRYPLPF